MDVSTADLVLAALAAVVLAALATPVGVSGAAFLLPVQISLLGVPSPAVTPTNLVFNVVSTPAGLLGHARDGRLAGPLTRPLLVGTVPGVVCGALVRTTLLPDAAAARLLAGVLLVPLGLSLLRRKTRFDGRRDPTTADPTLLVALAFAVTGYGTTTGIGGGSIISPLLLTLGFATRDVAAPALCTTFVASSLAVATFGLFDLFGVGATAAGPVWLLGGVLGLGGLVGNWIGVRLHRRLPETMLRRLLGVLAVVVGARYLSDS